jgi:hypothetical protein
MAIPYLTSATLPYGSRVVTIASVGYIANNFSTSDGLNVIERQTELGAPNGAVGIDQAMTGSAQLQLATTSTAVPEKGQEFSATVAAGAVTFFITERGLPEEAAGFKVVDISFRESV